MGKWKEEMRKVMRKLKEIKKWREYFRRMKDEFREEIRNQGRLWRER